MEMDRFLTASMSLPMDSRFQHSCILELRKEKSRDAARSRRGKENYEFYELAKLLPLPAAITSQLDKASIIRLSISYLKLRDFSSHGDPPWVRDGPLPNKSIKGGPPRRRNLSAVAMDIYETHQGTHILQSLDGFAFALSNDGRFLYISETVSIYLGLSQIEMAGSSIFDYVHQQDHPELAEQLCVTIPPVGSSVSSAGSGSDEESSTSTSRAMSPTIHDRTSLMTLNPSKGYGRSFCIRMKSTLTKRGVHVKTSGYRVVYMVGRFRPQFSYTMSRKHPAPLLGLVGLAIALPPPTITELRIESDVFITRLGPELKVVYCENAISNLMDLTSDDLSNKNLYDFCHPGDLHILRKSHVDLINKGQTQTEYYRLMNKHGGYVWVQTCITSLCGSKTPDELNSIAINYVLSGVEFGGCVMDNDQLQMVIGNENVHSNQSDSEPGSEAENSTSKDVENDNQPTSRGQTRVCSESNPTERRISSSEQVTLEGCSPNENSTYTEDKAPARNYIVYNDKTDTGQRDSKNSRRKMDRPRKRRRDYDSEEDSLDGSAKRFNSDAMRVPHIDSDYNHKGAMDEHMNAAVSCSRLSESPDLMRSNRISSPGPQDLTVKSCSVSQSGLQDGPAAEWERISSDSDMLHGAGASTVKDLEDAMNRHLPTMQQGDTSTEYEHDFNDTSLTENFPIKHKSTIQWIGSNQSTASDTLPASNLLRSLYASRESVIRSSARPHYYNELPVNMLTPPGGADGYKDHGSFSVYPLASTMNTKSHTTGAAHYPPMSSYSTSPISISMATNMTDSYSITPPSSVSPEDKLQSPTIADPNYNDSLSSEISRQRIPVKPQAYAMALTVPPAIDYEPVKSSAYHNANYSRNGTDYYHPHIINNGSSAAMYNQTSHDQGSWFTSTFQSQ